MIAIRPNPFIKGQIFYNHLEKFKGDSYAEETLARAKEMPESEDRQSALKGILTEKMKSDLVFGDEIKNLLDEMPKDAASTHIAFDQRGADLRHSDQYRKCSRNCENRNQIGLEK
jgi:hypothetical protein